MFRLHLTRLATPEGEDELSRALAEQQRIDARDLVLGSDDVRRIVALLPRSDDGRREFRLWRFENASFGDGCDFAGCFFYGVAFTGCTFGDNVSFSATDFTRSRFSRTLFGDECSFDHAHFGVKAEFQEAQFGDRARFSSATFGSLRMAHASFGTGAAFTRACFHGPARCHGVRFGARASFNEATFMAGCDFSGAEFGEKLQMPKVTFGATASFHGAVFGSRARLQGWELSNGAIILRSARFLGDVTLHRAKVNAGQLDLDHATLNGAADLGEIQICGNFSAVGTSLNGPERIGPIFATQEIRLERSHVYAPCTIEVSARRINMEDARVFAPVRVVVGRGDLVLDRLDTTARLVLEGRPETEVGRSDLRVPPARLVSARSTDLATAVVSGLDVRPLRLAGSVGIDSLQLESGASFESVPPGRRAPREAIAEEHFMRAAGASLAGWWPVSTRCDDGDYTALPAVELARLYRSLRKAREDNRDWAGAADFYYGEMEMRRLDAHQNTRVTRQVPQWLLALGNVILLELYRLLGGYGVRPSRPLALFLALLVAGAFIVSGAGLVHHSLPVGFLPETGPTVDLGESFVFVIRSALLLPTSSTVVPSPAAEWVQIAARILGPISIGLFALGVRARVQR